MGSTGQMSFVGSSAQAASSLIDMGNGIMTAKNQNAIQGIMAEMKKAEYEAMQYVATQEKEGAKEVLVEQDALNHRIEYMSRELRASEGELRKAKIDGAVIDEEIKQQNLTKKAGEKNGDAFSLFMRRSYGYGSPRR